jgi:CheY-like chemotaxis protein
VEGYNVVTASGWQQHSGGERGIPEGARQQDGTGLNILIVEDDPDTAATMAWLLRLEGHRVRAALDGPSAFEQMQNDRPDVVLLDIALPGMNGWQIAKHVSEQGASKKPFLIALTGYGRAADRCRSKEAGIHLHLVKPADPEFLFRVLRRFQAIILPDQISQPSRCSSSL